MKVAVIGLGKLGSSISAVIASKNIFVRGHDIDKEKVIDFNRGKPPVFENSLDILFKKNKKYISAYKDVAETIKFCSIIFITVPTPSEANGCFSLKYAKDAFLKIAASIKNHKSYHLIVFNSTVLPGSTRSVLVNLFEKISNKKLNKDFGVCYNPAFIALGSVVKDFSNPDFVLIGESDKKAGDLLKRFYLKILQKKILFKTMSIENAELAKIALNAYITTKITFANMLSKIAEKIPSGNIDTITKAIGMDKRIGEKYLSAGLGYGGPCFPRDNIALDYFAKKIKVNFPISKLVHNFNDKIANNVILNFLKGISKNKTIAVLGISYKTGSNILDESQGFLIAKLLSKRFKKVLCYDPMANKIDDINFSDNMELTDNLHKSVALSNVIIIANRDERYSLINSKNLKNKRIIDCWRLLSSKVHKNNYFSLGVDDNFAINKKNLERIWKQYKNS
jgi:UDPglucose 6-dehydrogenase